MEYKIFESSDTNVKKFVFEWGASAVTSDYCFKYY